MGSPDPTVTGNVVCGVSEDGQKLPQCNVKSDGACVFRFEGGCHYGQDVVDCLRGGQRTQIETPCCTHFLYDPEAVFVIAVQNTRSHERKDWHDISEDGFWGHVGETRDEEEGLVESLGVVRHLGAMSIIWKAL